MEAGLRHQLGPASESAHFRFRRWKRKFPLSNLEAGLSNVLRHQLGPRPNLEAQISPPAPRDLPPEPQRGHAETQSPRGSARGSGTRKLNRRRGSATARGSDTRKLKHQLSPASELESAKFRFRTWKRKFPLSKFDCEGFRHAETQSARGFRQGFRHAETQSAPGFRHCEGFRYTETQSPREFRHCEGLKHAETQSARGFGHCEGFKHVFRNSKP